MKPNGNDDPFALDTTAGALQAAARQLQEADRLMAGLENQQKELICHVSKVLDVLSKVEIERNTWHFRAEEMERERNLWQSKAEALEARCQKLARRATELAARTGEVHCPECGSGAVGLAADGGSEFTLRCQECGHREDAP